MGPWLGAMIAGAVALGGEIDGVLVVGVEVAGGQVGAEEIAGEQDLVLDEEAQHGLGPVHPGGEHELQALAAQVQHGAVGDDVARAGRHAQVRGQQIGALLVGHDPDAREALADGRDAARVILLGVVADHVVELSDPQLVEVGEEILGQRGLDGVDESGLGLALDQVGVVAGAERQRDERIEEAAIPVDRADREHTFFDLA
jgi:hypothetical protein